MPQLLKVVGWLNLAFAGYCVVVLIVASFSVPTYGWRSELGYVLPFYISLGAIVTWGVLSIGVIQGRRPAIVLWGVIVLVFLSRFLYELDEEELSLTTTLAFLLQVAGLVSGLASWKHLPKPEGSWRRKAAERRPFADLKSRAPEDGKAPAEKSPAQPPFPKRTPALAPPLRTAYDKTRLDAKRREAKRGPDRARGLVQLVRVTQTQADHRKRKVVLLTAVAAAAVGFGIAFLLQPAPTTLPVAPESETWEERRTREQAEKRTAFYVEHGLRELASGDPGRAIPYLATAYARGDDSVPVRFLLAQACLPAGGGQWTLTGHGGKITAIDIDPTGRHVVTASEDGTARLWDARDGRALRTLVGHRGPLTAVCFDTEGLRVATAGTDGKVGVWVAATGERIVTLVGHRGAVNDVVFSPGGTRLLTIGADGSLRAWSANDGEPQTSLVEPEKTLVRLVLAPDGSRVVGESAGGRLRVWDGQWGTALFTRGDETVQFRHVVFGADGRRFSAASQLGAVHVWESVQGGQLFVLDADAGAVHDVGFDLTGRLVVTAHEDESARVWDVETGLPVSRFAGHQGPVRASAFLPDGTLVLSAGADGQAHVWDAFTGTRLRTLDGDGTPLVDARVTPDGARAVLVAHDGTARLWDVHLEQRRPATVLAWARECVPWRLENGHLLSADLPADRRRFVAPTAPPIAPAEPPAAAIAPALLAGEGCESLDLRVELFARSAVATDQPFEASARVVNTGSTKLEDVLLGISPETGLRQVGRDDLVVRVPSLDSGASHEIRRVFVASEGGTVTLTASAREKHGRTAARRTLDLVAHPPAAAAPAEVPAGVEAGVSTDCAVSTVVEPRDVLSGNPFVVTAQVTNTGDAVLEDVVLGFVPRTRAVHVGEEPLELRISRLAPGATREHACTFAATQAGAVRVDVAARDAQSWASASGHCVVAARGLVAVELGMVDLAGDHRRKGVFAVGEEVRYLVEVANDRGSAPAEGLRLTWLLPAELVFESGEGGGDVTLIPDEKRRLVTSSPFDLAPNERRRIEILARVHAASPSGLVQTAVSVLGNGDVVLARETESTTLVAAGESAKVPAYEIEMTDASADGEPKGVFEKGETFLYTVTVRNDGSEVRTPKLDVVFALSEHLVFVSGRGDHGITVTGSGQQARTSAFTIGPRQARNVEILVTCIEVPDAFTVTSTASLGDAASGLEIARETASTTLRPRLKTR